MYLQLSIQCAQQILVKSLLWLRPSLLAWVPAPKELPDCSGTSINTTAQWQMHVVIIETHFYSMLNHSQTLLKCFIYIKSFNPYNNQGDGYYYHLYFLDKKARAQSD